MTKKYLASLSPPIAWPASTKCQSNSGLALSWSTKSWPALTLLPWTSTGLSSLTTATGIRSRCPYGFHDDHR